MTEFELNLVTDFGPMQWLQDTHVSDPSLVGSQIPSKFKRVVRMPHPAYADGETMTQPTQWATLASVSGANLTGEVQFGDIVAPGDPGRWSHYWHGAPPLEGGLPTETCASLVRVLRRHTSTPEDCWMSIWDGWSSSVKLIGWSELGWWYRGFRYFVAREPLERACRFLPYMGSFFHTPNMWWPSDQRWFVSTGIDSYSTYIGADEDCIEEILGARDLEALLVEPGTRADPGSFYVGTRTSD